MTIKEQVTKAPINHKHLLSFHISRQQCFHPLNCISMRETVLK